MENQINNPGSQSALPNATAVLVLGILSILGCFCYGIIGLILGIIAIVLASKDSKLYKINPDAYTPGSYSNIKAGKVCAIIGVILSSLYVVFALFIVAILGTAALSGNPQDIIDRLNDLN